MSLKKKALAGTAWTTGAMVTKVVVQIVRLSILTRLLEKSDFGLVAIVTVVLGFTQLFTDMGVSVALFSRNDLTIKQRSGLYWMSIILAVIMYVLLIAVTPLVKNFYEMPKLGHLLPLMGLDLIISSASRQFKVYKQKDFEFKQVALIDIVTNVSSLLLAWFLALRGWGVYSLILSTLFSSFASSFLIIITTIKRYPLQLFLNLKENIGIYKVGVYQLGSQILDYLSNQIDVLLIGKLMDVSELGVYNLIKQLANRIYALLSSIITTVATPILAKIKDDKVRFQGNFLKFLEVVAFVSVGAFASIFLSSELVLSILYGQDYRSYYPILQIITVFLGISLFVSGASRLIIISGKTEIGFKWTLIRFAVNPLVVYIGSFYGLKGIVYAQLAYMVIFFPVYYYMVVIKVFSRISFFTYSKPLVRNIFISGTMLILTHLASIILPANSYTLYVIISLLIFIGIYLFFNRRIVALITNSQT